jgi:3-hydroxyacyl-CoA dehydrogenase
MTLHLQKRKNMKKLIGIAGGGAMGSGIAQIITN